MAILMLTANKWADLPGSLVILLVFHGDSLLVEQGVNLDLDKQDSMQLEVLHGNLPLAYMSTLVQLPYWSAIREVQAAWPV